MYVNSLPMTVTVTRQRRSCDSNPGPFAPESSTLTTRLPATRVPAIYLHNDNNNIKHRKLSS